MTRIIRTAYRYRRPPRKRAKAAAIEGPAIVAARRPKVPANLPAGWLPETDEEHRRRGKSAEALFRKVTTAARRRDPLARDR